MLKKVEILILRKKALMNESFAKSNALRADGEELAEEVNALVDMYNTNQNLNGKVVELNKEIVKLEKK